jgi:hypothetical protein
VGGSLRQESGARNSHKFQKPRGLLSWYSGLQYTSKASVSLVRGSGCFPAALDSWERKFFLFVLSLLFWVGSRLCNFSLTLLGAILVSIGEILG